jgi:hypothetical protein
MHDEAQSAPAQVPSGGLAEVIEGSRARLSVRTAGGSQVAVAAQGFPDDWSFTRGDMVMLLPAEGDTLVAIPYVLVEGTRPHRQVYAFDSHHERRLVASADG